MLYDQPSSCYFRTIVQVFGWDSDGGTEFNDVVCSYNSAQANGGCLNSLGAGVVGTGTAMQGNVAGTGGCIRECETTVFDVSREDFERCGASNKTWHGSACSSRYHVAVGMCVTVCSTGAMRCFEDTAIERQLDFRLLGDSSIVILFVSTAACRFTELHKMLNLAGRAGSCMCGQTRPGGATSASTGVTSRRAEPPATAVSCTPRTGLL